MDLYPLWLIFLYFVEIYTAAASTPPVKVSLRSSWPSPPFPIEILESIALEIPDAFFPLLNSLTPSHITGTPRDVYTSIIHSATENGHLYDPDVTAAVEMTLALHAATPKIEAFYQLYADTYSEQDRLCTSWVDWYGEVVCDVDTLKRLIETHDLASTPPKPKTFSFDHIYPIPSRTPDPPPLTAILYTDLTSPTFRALHDYLFASASRVEYVLRYIPPLEQRGKNWLSGYGVALDLKKTDYLALDDRRSASSSQDDVHHAGEGHEGGAAEEDIIFSLLDVNYPETSDVSSSEPLTPEEISNLGLQSLQLISSFPAPQRLQALKRLSQDFPKYTGAIARRVVVSEEVQAGARENMVHARPGVDVVWLNGAVVNEKDMNPFALLRLLRKERTVMNSLTTLGLSRKQAFELLTHPDIASNGNEGTLDSFFDSSDRTEGGKAIVWWNDLENDARYARWSDDVRGILRPLYPGQFHNVRVNLYNIVLVLDLSKTSSLNFITGAVSNIIARGLPVRFGVVPIVEDEEGEKMARLIYRLVKSHGSVETMDFLKSFSQNALPPQLQTPSVDWRDVEMAYESSPLSGNAPFDEVFGGGDEDVENSLSQARAYASRLDTTLEAYPHGHAFVNGKHLNMDDQFLRNLQIEINQQQSHLQEKLYSAELSEDAIASISTYFYDLPSTSSRRNRHVYAADNAGLRIVNFLDLCIKTGLQSSPESYIYPTNTDNAPLSVHIIAGLDDDESLPFLKEALTSMEPESPMRLSFIHNPKDAKRVEDLPRRISSIVSRLASAKFLTKVSPTDLLSAFDGGGKGEFAGTKSHGHLDQDEEEYDRFVRACRLFVRELQIPPGKQAIVINGRVVGPIPRNEFIAEDFKTLAAYELRKRTEPVIRALNSTVPSLDETSLAYLASIASSIVASTQLPDPSEIGLFDASSRPRSRNYQYLGNNHTSFTLGRDSDALYQFAFHLDPINEATQKWSVLIEWLSANPDVFIQVYLTPPKHNELPLKRFYRYNVSPTVRFDSQGEELPAPVVFTGLPVEPIYTLFMDVMQSWLVRPREALYDLDNIQLDNLLPEDRVQGVEAVFVLDYLVVEGHARDTLTSSPPRGLQLQLTKRNGTPVDDTQVVANLGYLQFKAKPGIPQLELRAGRGRDVYKMESVGTEGWNSPLVEVTGNEITLTSFEGLTLYPRVIKRPGMERESLSDQPTDKLERPSPFRYFQDLVSRSASFSFLSTANVDAAVSRVKSFFRFLSSTNDGRAGQRAVERRAGDNQAEINIFTVASGLLYERFVSIMVTSVLRNTNSSVKFWFIENFLSPSFLEFIPFLAEEYGFEYELITYKWPSWLRPQKEKQRMIWAYKILFLDVLFPMDLKKVIFVDADQIVRADLKELVDLDLQGRPYGYTPMGDDNVEMEGYRFWKTGYWREFLQGLPYHISALYVIDLVQFREIAAGDILRGQYQALSADPNSLANLDQDLPNNLQREVPIFSLHEDWLWCETWCSKDRLHRAKTIDLCQNPLTREPKLARARKIPEWEVYDREISEFSRKLVEKGLIHSRFAAADTNALAGEVKQSAEKPSTTENEPAQDTIVSKRDEL